MASMNTVLGLALVAAGLVIATLGHKRLPVREGPIMRAFSAKGWGSNFAARLQSIALGVLLIGFGLSLIFA
jgi:hypothetical protein